MYKERVKLGEAKLVRTDDRMPITMDGSASSIIQGDGSVLYYFTDLGEKPYCRAFRGTVSDPFVKQEFTFEWDFNEYPDVWPCGIWAQTIYKCDDGMLIGFCHREDFSYEDKTCFINYHIGLGVSNDGGRKWFYAGDICGTGSNYIPKCFANMGGCPTVIKDGYFYVHFNEYSRDSFNEHSTERVKRISAARFKVDETIAALKQKKLPKVFKYSGNGEWNTPGIGGVGAPIITLAPFGSMPEAICIDSHSKAAYCKALGCYIMTFQTGRIGELLLYFSSDCEHWDEYMSVDSISAEHNGEFIQTYSSFVDLSGNGRADSFTVGDRFMLHFVHKSTKDYAYDEYYTREIEII